MAPHARVGQHRRAAFPSLALLYTMGVPGTYTSISRAGAMWRPLALPSGCKMRQEEHCTACH